VYGKAKKSTYQNFLHVLHGGHLGKKTHCCLCKIAMLSVNFSSACRRRRNRDRTAFTNKKKGFAGICLTVDTWSGEACDVRLKPYRELP
jgi:hypothetical protein